MTRIGRSLLAVAAVVTFGVASAGVAWADDAKSVQVATQEGREVGFLVYLDPNLSPAKDAALTSKVVVSGVEIPSEAKAIVQDTAPKQAVLVLDVSGSMRGARLASAKQAATAYVNGLPDDVEIGLVSFNDTATANVDPTTDKKKVIAAIEELKAGNKTALYDGAIAGFDMANADKGARLLLLSDGGDTASAATVEDVSARAKADGVAVDVVALTPSLTHTEVLRSIATPSGGQFLLAADATGLNEAFSEATGSFGGKVKVSATVPDDVDASGKFAIVTVGVDGTDFTGTTQLPQDSALGSTASSTTTPGLIPGVPTQTAPARSTGLGPWFAALLGAVIVAALAFAVAAFRRERTARLRREQVLWYTHAVQTGTVGRRPQLEQDGILQGLDTWMSKRSWYDAVDTKIDNAGLGMQVATWVIARTFVIVIAALLLSLVFPSPLLGLVVGAIFGWLGTRAWLNSRAAARRKQFEAELPDFLLLIASALRSGLSFQQGIDSAAQEGTGEVSRQMRRALNEAQMGSTMEAALSRIAERMHNEDLTWTVVALTIQREVGGNLSNILDSAAQTIKSREELRREVSALSAEGRLSGWVLAGLPVGIFVFLYFTNREYISFFWSYPLGYALLALIVILFIAGFLWVRRLVRIEV